MDLSKRTKIKTLNNDFNSLINSHSNKRKLNVFSNNDAESCDYNQKNAKISKSSNMAKERVELNTELYGVMNNFRDYDNSELNESEDVNDKYVDEMHDELDEMYEDNNETIEESSREKRDSFTMDEENIEDDNIVSEIGQNEDYRFSEEEDNYEYPKLQQTEIEIMLDASTWKTALGTFIYALKFKGSNDLISKMNTAVADAYRDYVENYITDAEVADHRVLDAIGKINPAEFGVINELLQTYNMLNSVKDGKDIIKDPNQITIDILVKGIKETSIAFYNYVIRLIIMRNFHEVLYRKHIKGLLGLFYTYIRGEKNEKYTSIDRFMDARTTAQQKEIRDNYPVVIKKFIKNIGNLDKNLTFAGDVLNGKYEFKRGRYASNLSKLTSIVKGNNFNELLVLYKNDRATFNIFINEIYIELRESLSKDKNIVIKYIKSLPENIDLDVNYKGYTITFMDYKKEIFEKYAQNNNSKIGTYENNILISHKYMYEKNVGFLRKITVKFIDTLMTFIMKISDIEDIEKYWNNLAELLNKNNIEQLNNNKFNTFGKLSDHPGMIQIVKEFKYNLGKYFYTNKMIYYLLFVKINNQYKQINDQHTIKDIINLDNNVIEPEFDFFYKLNNMFDINTNKDDKGKKDKKDEKGKKDDKEDKWGGQSMFHENLEIHNEDFNKLLPKLDKFYNDHKINEIIAIKRSDRDINMSKDIDFINEINFNSTITKIRGDFNIEDNMSEEEYNASKVKYENVYVRKARDENGMYNFSLFSFINSPYVTIERSEYKPESIKYLTEIDEEVLRRENTNKNVKYYIQGFNIKRETWKDLFGDFVDSLEYYMLATYKDVLTQKRAENKILTDVIKGVNINEWVDLEKNHFLIFIKNWDIMKNIMTITIPKNIIILKPKIELLMEAGRMNYFDILENAHPDEIKRLKDDFMKNKQISEIDNKGLQPGNKELRRNLTQKYIADKYLTEENKKSKLKSTLIDLRYKVYKYEIDTVVDLLMKKNDKMISEKDFKDYIIDKYRKQSVSSHLEEEEAERYFSHITSMFTEEIIELRKLFNSKQLPDFIEYKDEDYNSRIKRFKNYIIVKYANRDLNNMKSAMSNSIPKTIKMLEPKIQLLMEADRMNYFDILKNTHSNEIEKLKAKFIEDRQLQMPVINTEILGEDFGEDLKLEQKSENVELRTKLTKEYVIDKYLNEVENKNMAREFIIKSKYKLNKNEVDKAVDLLMVKREKMDETIVDKAFRDFIINQYRKKRMDVLFEERDIIEYFTYIKSIFPAEIEELEWLFDLKQLPGFTEYKDENEDSRIKRFKNYIITKYINKDSEVNTLNDIKNGRVGFDTKFVASLSSPQQRFLYFGMKVLLRPNYINPKDTTRYRKIYIMSENTDMYDNNDKIVRTGYTWYRPVPLFFEIFLDLESDVTIDEGKIITIIPPTRYELGYIRISMGYQLSTKIKDISEKFYVVDKKLFGDTSITKILKQTAELIEKGKDSISIMNNIVKPPKSVWDVEIRERDGDPGAIQHMSSEEQFIKLFKVKVSPHSNIYDKYIEFIMMKIKPEDYSQGLANLIMYLDFEGIFKKRFALGLFNPSALMLIDKSVGLPEIYDVLLKEEHIKIISDKYWKLELKTALKDNIKLVRDMWDWKMTKVFDSVKESVDLYIKNNYSKRTNTFFSIDSEYAKLKEIVSMIENCNKNVLFFPFNDGCIRFPDAYKKIPLFYKHYDSLKNIAERVDIPILHNWNTKHQSRILFAGVIRDFFTFIQENYTLVEFISSLRNKIMKNDKLLLTKFNEISEYLIKSYLSEEMRSGDVPKMRSFVKLLHEKYHKASSYISFVINEILKLFVTNNIAIDLDSSLPIDIPIGMERISRYYELIEDEIFSYNRKNLMKTMIINIVVNIFSDTTQNELYNIIQQPGQSIDMENKNIQIMTDSFITNNTILISTFKKDFYKINDFITFIFPEVIKVQSDILFNEIKIERIDTVSIPADVILYNSFGKKILSTCNNVSESPQIKLTDVEIQKILDGIIEESKTLERFSNNNLEGKDIGEFKDVPAYEMIDEFSIINFLTKLSLIVTGIRTKGLFSQRVFNRYYKLEKLGSLGFTDVFFELYISPIIMKDIFKGYQLNHTSTATFRNFILAQMLLPIYKKSVEKIRAEKSGDEVIKEFIIQHFINIDGTRIIFIQIFENIQRTINKLFDNHNSKTNEDIDFGITLSDDEIDINKILSSVTPSCKNLKNGNFVHKRAILPINIYYSNKTNECFDISNLPKQFKNFSKFNDYFNFDITEKDFILLPKRIISPNTYYGKVDMNIKSVNDGDLIELKEIQNIMKRFYFNLLIPDSETLKEYENYKNEDIFLTNVYNEAIMKNKNTDNFNFTKSNDFLQFAKNNTKYNIVGIMGNESMEYYYMPELMNQIKPDETILKHPLILERRDELYKLNVFYSENERFLVSTKIANRVDETGLTSLFASKMKSILKSQYSGVVIENATLTDDIINQLKMIDELSESLGIKRKFHIKDKMQDLVSEIIPELEKVLDEKKSIVNCSLETNKTRPEICQYVEETKIYENINSLDSIKKSEGWLLIELINIDEIYGSFNLIEPNEITRYTSLHEVYINLVEKKYINKHTLKNYDRDFIDQIYHKITQISNFRSKVIDNKNKFLSMSDLETEFIVNNKRLPYYSDKDIGIFLSTLHNKNNIQEFLNQRRAKILLEKIELNEEFPNIEEERLEEVRAIKLINDHIRLNSPYIYVYTTRKGYTDAITLQRILNVIYTTKRDSQKGFIIHKNIDLDIDKKVVFEVMNKWVQTLSLMNKTEYRLIFPDNEISIKYLEELYSEIVKDKKIVISEKFLSDVHKVLNNPQEHEPIIDSAMNELNKLKEFVFQYKYKKLTESDKIYPHSEFIGTVGKLVKDVTAMSEDETDESMYPESEDETGESIQQESINETGESMQQESINGDMKRIKMNKYLNMQFKYRTVMVYPLLPLLRMIAENSSPDRRHLPMILTSSQIIKGGADKSYIPNTLTMDYRHKYLVLMKVLRIVNAYRGTFYKIFNYKSSRSVEYLGDDSIQFREDIEDVQHKYQPMSINMTDIDELMPREKYPCVTCQKPTDGSIKTIIPSMPAIKNTIVSENSKTKKYKRRKKPELSKFRVATFCSTGCFDKGTNFSKKN